MKAAFTLLELLFVLAVVAVVTAIALPATTGMSRYTARVKTLTNLRQIGVAARLYANDHDQSLPGGADPTPDAPARWPALFCDYLTPNDSRVFLDPADPAAARLPLAEALSNTQNRTGYVCNGFDELGDGANPPAAVSLVKIEHPVNTVLMSQKSIGSSDFCVNVLFKPLAALNALLNPKAFEGGSYYLYVDGSVRYLKQTEYSDQMWQLNPPVTLPSLPLSTPAPIVPDGPAGTVHS